MQVVVRLGDKTKVKGDTTDFHPDRESFTIRPPGRGVPPVQVAMRDLKAVYFVRSLDGNPDRSDHLHFHDQGKARPKIWLEFKDGEHMAAWPVSPALGRTGFYVIPTDSDSNLEKAWIHRPSLKRILEGQAAVRAARRYSTIRRQTPRVSGGSTDLL